MEENKEYYVFISYKSEDVEWAIWLQHELEHYHLPASFNVRTDIRQELRPVFRDIDELSAGNLPEQIKRALENSQNLIVVCSPQAAASTWVNQEVETFISLGRTDRIFPFIVEGNSPKEFFPPALLALPKNEERLGGDASIEDIHQLLTKELSVDKGIRHRRVGITGTNYHPLDNEFQIREALYDTCDLINGKENIFEKALLTLVLLSYIQAFTEGIGGTGTFIRGLGGTSSSAAPAAHRRHRARRHT